MIDALRPRRRRVPKAARRLSEQELELVRLAAGWRHGCPTTILVRRYQESIYATIYHMDVEPRAFAQYRRPDAFIKAFRPQILQGRLQFLNTWIYRIAVKKTINFAETSGENRSQMSLNAWIHAEHDPGPGGADFGPHSARAAVLGGVS